MSRERVLVVSHGHPVHSKGGAEVAAYAMFRELQRRDIDTLFLARTDRPAHGGSAFSTYRSDRELLFHTGMADFFDFRSACSRHVHHDFAGLLARYRPTVVHFHHYVHMGLELFREVRRTCPEARIILTLHEYLAICHHNGQMVRPRDHALCYGATPFDCARCYPEHSPADFFLRERYIKSFLALVDHFISPSEFLRERYVAWGLPADRMTVIENGQPPSVLRTSSDASGAAEDKVRFGFFGQLNPYKGIDLLLEAVALLKRRERRRIQVKVHGANLENQPPEFQARVHELSSTLRDTVHFHGSYEAERLPALMAGVDYLVIPSTWWENSPIVIQEAFCHGRPVIGSDIGGVAEKIRHEVDGLHFHARDPESLAATFRRCLSEPELHDRLVAGIRPPPTLEETAAAILGIYESLHREPDCRQQDGDIARAAANAG